jgi:hypothetical protein
MSYILISPKNNIDYYKNKNTKLKKQKISCECQEVGCEKCNYTGFIEVEYVPFLFLINEESFIILLEILNLKGYLNDNFKNEIYPHLINQRISELKLEDIEKFNKENYNNELDNDAIRYSINILYDISIEAERREDLIIWEKNNSNEIYDESNI